MKEETARLYFEDAYLTEFESRVIERLEYESRPALVLERTAFYPEGGGQPADRGTLNGVEVVDVVESEGRVLHVAAGPIEGEILSGAVDFVRRFDHMQQHAGQHILSQIFWRELKGETRSFHLSEDHSTLEIGIGSLTDEDLERVEARANAMVFGNKEIRSYFVPEKKIAEVPLRRPPKVSGSIRVVEIEGWEYSACGGTHPRRTGEIGLIKILGWDKIRGNLRFTFVCGARALREFSGKTRILAEAAGRFSSAESEVPAAIDKLMDEAKQAKRSMKKLREQASNWEAEQVLRAAEGPVISRVFSDRPLEEVKLLATSIIKRPSCILVFGVRLPERTHLILARSEDVEFSMRELIPRIAPLFNARGGGGPSLVELAGEGGEGFDQAFDRALSFLKGVFAGQ